MWPPRLHRYSTATAERLVKVRKPLSPIIKSTAALQVEILAAAAISTRADSMSCKCISAELHATLSPEGLDVLAKPQALGETEKRPHVGPASQ